MTDTIVSRRAEFIEKSDDAGFVLAVALVPEEVDSQSEIVSAEEIRRAAYSYMQGSQAGGLNHQEIVKGMHVVESFIARGEMSIAGTRVKPGSWLVGFAIQDPKIRAMVLNGTLSGVSIGGTGFREEEEDV